MPDLKIKEGWYDDDQVPPEYLAALKRVESLIDILRQNGLSVEMLANVMINLHVRFAAELKPTDEQLNHLAAMFVESVKALRDKSPEAYQMVGVEAGNDE